MSKNIDIFMADEEMKKDGEETAAPAPESAPEATPEAEGGEGGGGGPSSAGEGEEAAQ